MFVPFLMLDNVVVCVFRLVDVQQNKLSCGSTTRVLATEYLMELTSLLEAILWSEMAIESHWSYRLCFLRFAALTLLQKTKQIVI